ncbi:MAG: hypothetical protein EOP06_02080 [Proteobacteria bacterium]|nr:MAG: hypothetical protein EOP06_02080 [Pseudomonadota bacterium]
MPLFKIVILTLLLANTAHAVNRVGVKKLDIGEVETVYLAPGLITVMEFPEAITEVSTGAPQIYRLQISSVHKEELIVQIQNRYGTEFEEAPRRDSGARRIWPA